MKKATHVPKSGRRPPSHLKINIHALPKTFIRYFASCSVFLSFGWILANSLRWICVHVCVCEYSFALRALFLYIPPHKKRVQKTNPSVCPPVVCFSVYALPFPDHEWKFGADNKKSNENFRNFDKHFDREFSHIHVICIMHGWTRDSFTFTYSRK